MSGVSSAYRPCPDGAVLMVRGEAFPCDAMRHMHESCHIHDGWPHSNMEAEAIWTPADVPAGINLPRVASADSRTSGGTS